MEVLNQNENFQTQINQNLNEINSQIYQTFTNPEDIDSKQQIKEPTCTLEKFLPDKTSNFKKTLVLDLDETLIHSNFFNLENSKFDIYLELVIENRKMQIHVLIRPGVEEFLEKMSKLFEIVIFTASLSQYAIPIIEQLDKKKLCNFKLFREHCSFMNNSFTKDLKKLNRNMNDIIIIDNNPNCYILNSENGIPIKSWLNDINDRELIKIIPYLEFLSDINDVREFIPKMKNGNVFDYIKADLLLDEEKIRKEEEEKEKIKRENERKELERKRREEEVLLNDLIKERESKEKELELKKIEEKRKKNEEMKKKNKIEQEIKMKELEESMKEKMEKEKNDRINLVEIIDYSNKNKMNQNFNTINQDNNNYYSNNMPKISLNNSINTILNSNISLHKINSFRTGNKNLTQTNFLIKKESITPKLLVNVNMKTIDNQIFAQYNNNVNKKSFKLKDRISFDELKLNVSKNENNQPPQKIKRRMSLKTARKINVLINPNKKLYLKRKNSPNSGDLLKNEFTTRGRNLIKSLDFKNFQKEFINLENE